MYYDKEVQRFYRTQAILAASPWLFLILIAFIGIIVAIFEPRVDPLDASVWQQREVAADINVTDENGNGFRVIYATDNNVTEARLWEIRSRRSVKDSLARLDSLAPLHFGDMLYTDIYDFADFAIRFDPADISIHNIAVCGREKVGFYFGDNPRLENDAEYRSSNTSQGLLYLRAQDIYYRPRGKKGRYRYFKCHGINESSETDEHFSHFTEEERLQ